MSQLTAWGYSINSDEALPDMMSMEDFTDFTANKYAGDERLTDTLKAACAAVRNYCGWHIYPAVECSMSEYLLRGNGRVKCVGNDLQIQLPATLVSAVSGVLINDSDHDDFALENNGMIHVFDVGLYAMSRKTKVTVLYTAGFPAGQIDGIKELIANRVIQALSSSGGVQTESAGGVSITYSSSWANTAGAGQLTDTNKEILMPYKVRGVF